MFTDNRTDPARSLRRRTYLTVWFVRARSRPARVRREEGQATVEYALVVLAAAAIALLLIAWAAKTGKIDQLLDVVFDKVLAKAT